MTADELTAYREIGGALAAIVGTAVLAWRARGRKELQTPYAPNHEDQPRVVTRKEWHDVVNLVNGIPSISARSRRNEERLTRLERDFSEHLRATAAALESFTRLEANFEAHQNRWEEVGVEAREHRQRLEAQLLRLEEKVDRKAGH